MNVVQIPFAKHIVADYELQWLRKNAQLLSTKSIRLYTREKGRYSVVCYRIPMLITSGVNSMLLIELNAKGIRNYFKYI